MAKICYQAKRFTSKIEAMIQQADTLVREYQAQGLTLTLRQLFYLFVSRDLFPDDQTWRPVPGTTKWERDPQGTKNATPNYKWLGDIVGDARMAGLLDWGAFEDRTRELENLNRWEDPGDIIQTCVQAFNLDLWKDQAQRLEVWIEKDALSSIATTAAHSRGVDAFSCRGYTSMSSLWEAAQRLRRYMEQGQAVTILHLGDHDPSGLDMTRDIHDRLNQFLLHDWAPGADEESVRADMFERCGADEIEVARIALTMAQVRRYNPPPNPAKATDARYKVYRAQYGDESWELDALRPEVLRDLIVTGIEQRMDVKKYNARCKEQTMHRKHLEKAAYHWTRGLAKHVSSLRVPGAE